MLQFFTEENKDFQLKIILRQY